MAKKGIFERTGASIDRGLESVSNKAKEYANSFKRSAEEIGKTVSNKAKRTYERASNFAKKQIEAGMKIVDEVKGFSSSVKKQAKEVIISAGSAAKTAGYIIKGASIEFGSSIKKVSVNTKNKIVTFTLKTGEKINVRYVQPAIRGVMKGKEAVLTAFYTVKGLSIVAANNIIALEKKLSAKLSTSFLKAKAELIKQGEKGLRMYHSMLSAINTAGKNSVRVMNASIAVVRSMGADATRFVYNKSKEAVEVTTKNGKKILVIVNNTSRATIKDIQNQLEHYEQIGRTA